MPGTNVPHMPTRAAYRTVPALSAYEPAMRARTLTCAWAICLRACYPMPGTDIAYEPTVFRWRPTPALLQYDYRCRAMLGTDLATWYYNTNDIQYMVLCDALVLSKCMVILLHRPYPPGFSSMRYVPVYQEEGAVLCPDRYDCLAMGQAPYGGLVTFDNVGLALMTVMQVMTLEGWSDIMDTTQ
eukprot:434297-Rhodomonas_salina.1